MEWKLENESVNNTSHSRVRTSHGLNFTDLIDKEYDDNEQETSETKGIICVEDKYLLLQADPRKQNHEEVPLLAHLQELYLFVKTRWIDIEPGAQSINRVPSGKTTEYSLRHESQRRAIEFWNRFERLSSERY